MCTKVAKEKEKDTKQKPTKMKVPREGPLFSVLKKNEGGEEVKVREWKALAVRYFIDV